MKLHASLRELTRVGRALHRRGKKYYLHLRKTTTNNDPLRSQRWRRNLLFVAILAAFFAFLVFFVEGLSISWDEAHYRSLGRCFSEHLLDPEACLPDFLESDLLSHGVATEVLYFLALDWAGVEESYFALHVVKGIGSSLVLVALFWILCRLHPNSLLAAWGALLLVLFPTWFGHAFDNHMDSVSCLLYALELALAVYLLEKSYQSVQLRTEVLSIAGLAAISAISFSHRIVLVIVPALCLGLLIARSLRQRRYVEIARSLALFGVIFFATLFLVDPMVRLRGLEGVIAKITYSSDFEALAGSMNRFEGQLWPSEDLPWHYLPKWILITTPVVTLLLAGIGLVEMLRRQRFPGRGLSSDLGFLISMSFILPIFAVILLRPVLYDAWRHFLFLAVPLVVIATLGLKKGFEVANKPWSKRALTLAIALPFAVTAKEMVELHPYQYLYFNRAAGGLEQAAANYETDYWAKSYREAAEWLRVQPREDDQRTYYVYVCGPEISAAHFFPPGRLVATPRSEMADYLICFTRENLHLQVAETQTLHAVERQGVRLSVVKAIPQLGPWDSLSEDDEIHFISKPGRVRGHVDVVTARGSEGDALALKGWAAEKAEPDRPLTILITLDGEIVSFGRNGLSRSDVAGALGDDRYQHSGWIVAVDGAAAGVNGDSLRVWGYLPERGEAYIIRR